MSNRRQAPDQGPAELNLVGSRRLQSLSMRAASDVREEVKCSPNWQEEAESSHLRRLITQRLSEILAQLPVGKQRSLFKIRYGVDLEQLEQLPVSRVAEILNIHPGQHAGSGAPAVKKWRR